MHRRETYDRIVDSGVVAVLRDIDKTDVAAVASAMHQGGVGAIEVTADARHCSEMVAAVDRALADTDAVVGAGTVLDAATAQNVIEAGATFMLAPNVNDEVIEVCNREGVVAIPGVMTPTEAVQAMEAGADILKLFPASTVGPEHIGAIQGPLGDVPIMPTGGISTDNVAEYFDGGAVAVGAGSALVDYDAIDRQDMDSIRQSAAEFVQFVEDARN